MPSKRHLVAKVTSIDVMGEERKPLIFLHKNDEMRLGIVARAIAHLKIHFEF